jgi:acyl carrier protein
MGLNNIQESILKFVSNKTHIPMRELKSDTKIYNSGIISSLAILELIDYVENEFKVGIKPEELIEDNFLDVNVLSNFINNKLAS